MENIFLTLLAIISIFYCCDLPAWSGFEFLINQKESMLYGVGLSIIAAYIFYVIQVYIPECKNRKKAELYLAPKIKDYLEDLYEVVHIIDSTCNIDERIGRITPRYEFIQIKRSDWKSIYVEQVDLKYYELIIKNKAQKIKNNQYYNKIGDKKVECLQNLFDSNFMFRLNENIKFNEEKIIDGDIIECYKKIKKDIDKARKLFSQDYIMTISGYDKNEITNELENVKKQKNRISGIARIKIGER